MVSVISKGFTGNPLNFSYKQRDNDDHLVDVAMLLKKVSDTTLGGILVFFPSYSALQRFVKYVTHHKLQFDKLVQYET